MLLFFLLLSNKSRDEVRFVPLPKHTQPIKMLAQTKDLITISKEFNTQRPLHDHMNQSFDIYQLRTRTSLVSSLYLDEATFHKKGKKCTYIIFYSIYTNPEFRQQGYAYKLINDAVEHYTKSKNITKYKLALHLNPNDAMMNINYAFYYSIGFDRGKVCENGPTSYQFFLDEVERMDDARKAVKSAKNEKYGLFAMFCDKIGKRGISDFGALMSEGEVLRNYLNSNNEKMYGKVAN